MTFNLENPFRKTEACAKKRLFAKGQPSKDVSPNVKDKVARVAREMKKPYGEFKILPKQVEFLQKLEQVIIKFNKAKSLEQAKEIIIRAIKEVDRLGNIVAVNFNKAGLNNLPPQIANLVKLKILKLGNNSISELPAELFTLADLEELDLDNNELEAVPEAIGQLKKIRVLNLHWNNDLKSLPESLCDLNELRELNCTCWKLGNLPASIGNLTKLEKLQVGAAIDRNSSERARIKQLFPFVNL